MSQSAVNWTRRMFGETVAALVPRLDALVDSLGQVERQLLTAHALTVTGAAGQLVPHGRTRPPRSVRVQLVGDTAVSAIVTVGAIDATHVRVYTTAACKVDVYGVL